MGGKFLMVQEKKKKKREKFLMVEKKKKKKRYQPEHENTLGVFQSARSYRESS